MPSDIRVLVFTVLGENTALDTRVIDPDEMLPIMGQLVKMKENLFEVMNVIFDYDSNIRIVQLLRLPEAPESIHMSIPDSVIEKAIGMPLLTENPHARK